MATKNPTSTGLTPENVPQRADYADFALVLKNGRELKCHRVRLAEVSQFFCAMVKQDCVETQTNKMQVTAFEPDTVESFLDWIYAELTLVPSQSVYKKDFEKERMTPDLLKMSHMYQAKNLQDECIQHLMANIEDANAVEIWTVSETIGNAKLKKVALDHLGKKGNKLLQLPGLNESFKSPPLMESLVTYMSDKMTSLAVAPDPDEVISVQVECYGAGNVLFSAFTIKDIKVKRSDTIRDLRHLTDNSIRRTREVKSRCKKGSFRNKIHNRDEIEEHKNVVHYWLGEGSTFLCDITYCDCEDCEEED